MAVSDALVSALAVSPPPDDVGDDDEHDEGGQADADHDGHDVVRLVVAVHRDLEVAARRVLGPEGVELHLPGVHRGVVGQPGALGGRVGEAVVQVGGHLDGVEADAQEGAVERGAEHDLVAGLLARVHVHVGGDVDERRLVVRGVVLLEVGQLEDAVEAVDAVAGDASKKEKKDS